MSAIQNFMNTFLRIHELRQNAAAQQAQQAYQNEQVKAGRAAMIQNAISFLGTLDEDARTPVMDMFAESAGLDRMHLSRAAAQMAESPQVKIQKMINEGLGELMPGEVAAPAATGQTRAALDEGRTAMGLKPEQKLAAAMISRGLMMSAPQQESASLARDSFNFQKWFQGQQNDQGWASLGLNRDIAQADKEHNAAVLNQARAADVLRSLTAGQGGGGGMGGASAESLEMFRKTLENSQSVSMPESVQELYKYFLRMQAEGLGMPSTVVNPLLQNPLQRSWFMGGAGR